MKRWHQWLVLLSVCLALTAGSPVAQQQPAAGTAAAAALGLDQRVPVEPAITAGTLPNGLRYYIRANKQPLNRAELRLVVKAGSILEDDDQQGLAHFVEHMGFNGTKNLPGEAVGRRSSCYPPAHAVWCGRQRLDGLMTGKRPYMLTVATDKRGDSGEVLPDPRGLGAQ